MGNQCLKMILALWPCKFYDFLNYPYHLPMSSHLRIIQQEYAVSPLPCSYRRLEQVFNAESSFFQYFYRHSCHALLSREPFSIDTVVAAGKYLLLLWGMRT